MSLRAVALVSGVVGGLCWLALSGARAGGVRRPGPARRSCTGPAWCCSAVAMVGFGASLVSSSAAVAARDRRGRASRCSSGRSSRCSDPRPATPRSSTASSAASSRWSSSSCLARRPARAGPRRRSRTGTARPRALSTRTLGPPGECGRLLRGSTTRTLCRRWTLDQSLGACGDDQPAHLAARPAGHRRRGRHERLRHRAGPAAGRSAASRSTSSPGRPPRRCRRSSRPATASGSATSTPARSRGSTKGELPGQLCVFAREVLRAEAGPAGRPLRRRALPLLALRPGRRAGPRPLGRAAGALDAHDGEGQERRARRRRHPRADRPDHRRGAGGRGRRHADRQHRHRGQAADQPVRRRPGPGRGRPPRRRPRVFRPARPGRGPGRARPARRTPHVLLFAGRIQPLKAPDVLLRAVGGAARARRPTLRSPPGRARRRRPVRHRPRAPRVAGPARRRARHRRRGPVRAAGRPGRAGRWCAAATLVAVPSYNESFGLVAVEAQATGTPVVAAAVGGLTTVVRDGHSGLLVDGHEPRDWAAALRRVVEDDRPAATGWRRARSSRPGSSSWDRTAERTLEVYRRAARRDAPGGRVVMAVHDRRRSIRVLARRQRDRVRGDQRRASSRSRCRARRSCRPRSGSTSGRTRSACTRSSAATPTRTTSGVYRWLLERNLQDVRRRVRRRPARRHLPRRAAAAGGRDRRGARPAARRRCCSYADESFNTILELGFASSIRKEWEWRKLRGEPTRNLEAFRGWLESGDEPDPS